MENLEQMLNTCDPYVQVLPQVGDIINTDNFDDKRIHIITARPGGQCIRPTIDKVATLIVGGEAAEAVGTDIIY